MTNMIVGRHCMCPVLFRKWFCSRSWSKYRTLFSKTGVWENSFKAEQRKEIEEYWKPKVQELDKTGLTDPDAEKYYVLSMFPYPSGRLHMGHVRVYTISDTMARYKRLLGKKTIHPMGWDAFGLPAENAAIDKGQHPATWTYSNIKSMKKQIEELCCSFDWDREIFTCDPTYYKWTQYIFLKMYETGLAYHKQALVNWDPVDQTVLADEQINDLGCSWRSGAKVEKRSLRQWYLKTTAYAKSLWDGLATVDQNLWKDIISLQKNWIGKCRGCHFYFTIMNGATELADAVAVYTKEPGAIFGVSHIVLAPSHQLNNPQYYHTPGAAPTAGNKDQDVLLTLKAIHPFTKAEIPVIVSPTTEFDMFNDCSLGIPCLSDKDVKMAQEFGLETVEVFATNGDQEILINSGQFTGLKKSEAVKSITEYAKQNNFGGHLVSGHLKDWLISRQRYWGTPIPLIHCEKCKVVPVPYQDLPVELATVKELSGRCIAPLSHLKDWQKVQCPQCGGPAQRETDTMDTFVDSSWYFLRYLDPHNDNTMFDPEIAIKEMPVDLYIGGKEHATLHLYYARFVSHFLYDLGVLAQKEPFINLLTQGMVMGRSYKVRDTGSYLSHDQVDFSGDHPVETATGLAVDTFWEKMSKSKMNGVDPEDVLDKFGVDSTRICILSNVAPKSHRNWSNEEFRGVINWQSRIWKLVSEFILLKTSGSFQEVSPQLIKQHEEKMFEFRNYFLKEVTFHFEKTFLISVAISRLQGFTNNMRKIPADVRASSDVFGSMLADFIIMLGPLAPSFASELWAGLSSVAPQNSSHDWSRSVLHQKWPKIDEKYQLRLIVKHKGVEIFSKFLPKYQLNRLTDQTAYEYILTSEKVRNRMKDSKLSDLRFHLDENYRAEFTIPH